MLAISKRIHSFNASLLSAEKNAEEVEEETPPEPQGPPEPEPGSEDWEYVDQPIEVVCALFKLFSFIKANLHGKTSAYVPQITLKFVTCQSRIEL